MELKKLTPQDSEEIGKIEANAYSEVPEFINGAEDFRDDLQEAENEENEKGMGSNFSYGLFDKGKLVGYIVGFRDESEVDDGEVAYVSDLAVLPEYRKGRAIYQLLKKFSEQAKELELPIEAEFRSTSYPIVADHPEMMEKLGFRVAIDHELEDYHAGENQHFVRLEPIVEATRKQVHQSIGKVSNDEGSEALKDQYWEEHDASSQTDHYDGIDANEETSEERGPHVNQVKTKRRGIRREKNRIYAIKNVEVQGYQEKGISKMIHDNILGKNSKKAHKRPNIKNELDDIRYDEDELKDYEVLLSFLREEDGRSTPMLSDFLSAVPLDRLKILKQMSLEDAIRFVIELGIPSSDYLKKRIDFYQNLIKGEIKKEEYDYQTGRNTLVPVQTGRDEVQVGLLRDILYAAMLGTPELGAFNRAKRNCSDTLKTNLPNLKGYHSGIFTDSDPGRIGNYEIISNTYLEALRFVSRRKKYKPSENESVQERLERERKMERDAVRTAADWWVKSAEYNDPKRGPRSPYRSSDAEALAYARLGETVQKQLKGMRQKINGVDLQNIKRFIGKAGENRKSKEKKRIFWKIKHFPADESTAFATTSIENEKDLYLLKRSKEDKSDEQFTLEKARLEKRNPQELLAEMGARLEKLDADPKSTNLAEKALYLHFFFRGTDQNDQQESQIDWINKAPFGLINWTYKALKKGVSRETALGYARVRYIFGNDTSINVDLIAKAGVLTGSHIRGIIAAREYNQRNEIQCTPDQYITMAPHLQFNYYEESIEAGYSVEDLTKFPWIISTLARYKDKNLPLFPAQAKAKSQERWCAENAFYSPRGWNQDRLGGMILRRLNSSIDIDLHDATFWLQEFECPDEVAGEKYKDPDAEVELFHAMMDIPERIQNKITSKRTKYQEFFSSEAALIIYESILPLYKKGPLDYPQVETDVMKQLDEYKTSPTRVRSLKSPIESIENEAKSLLERLQQRIDAGVAARPAPQMFEYLKEVNKRAITYIDQAQVWVVGNGQTPSKLLTYAWQNRRLALQEGVEDNPRAIEAWAKLNGLRVAFQEMEKNGTLPENIKREDISTYGDWMIELLRHYDAETGIKFISWIKDHLNLEQHIPTAKRTIDHEKYGEVLPKNSPYGATIGPATGCCMTLGGASQSCIEVGYSRPDAGFFALRREKAEELLAQSFIWVNESEAPDTLVLDNIEANKGRDIEKILSSYQKFFRDYLIEQKKRDPNFRIRKVYVGTGYTSIGLDDLKDVNSIARPYSGYTDASHQKLLLEIPEAEFNKITPLETSLFELNSESWAEIEEQIMNVEQHAFEGKGYSRNHMESLFTNPDNIAVVIKDGGKIVGYTVAEKRNNETLYISSTALLPSHQGKGYVKFLMERLDEEAVKKGFKNYERHARSDNGYADKLEKQYKVIEKGEDQKTLYGMQRYLAMEIPGSVSKGAIEPEHWELTGASRKEG